MKKMIAVVAMSFFGFAVAKDCHTIADDSKRLACYDKMNPIKTAEKPKTETAKKIDLTHWKTSSETSKIDDTKTVIIYNDSTEYVQGRFETTRPTMVIRCKNNRTEMYFNWGQRLKTEPFKVRAKIRFGKGKPKNYRFSASADFDAAFISKPIGFIKKAFKHDTMVVQMATAYTDASSVTFNIQGLDEVIKPLRKSCNW